MDSLDATHCPLCGGNNRCAMELERETGEKQPPCWCTQTDFNASLLESIPDRLKGKACICEACARRSVG